MAETAKERDRSLRDLIYYPVIFNVVGLVSVALLFTLSPEHSVEQDLLDSVLYLGVFITEWSLAYVTARRLGIRGIKEYIIPKKRFRWLPSILVFVSLNLFFTAYMISALVYGRIPPWGSLDLFKFVFFIVLNPLTAGFVEELIWRGYFIEKLLAVGKTEWKAIIFSSVSFALIHGVFIFDKLLVTFVFGIIAGAYYIRERNLPVLMVSHVVVDAIAFGLSFLLPV